MPQARHGDQQRVVHRFDVRAHGNKRVRTRADRFGNPVVHVSVPAVDERIEFHTRAVLVRDRTSFILRRGPLPCRPARCSPPRMRRSMTLPARSDRSATCSRQPMRSPISSDRRSSMPMGRLPCVPPQQTAWQLRRGVCQDMAHVMIAMCASLGHLRPLRLGSPPGRGREPCLDGGVRPCPSARGRDRPDPSTPHRSPLHHHRHRTRLPRRRSHQRHLHRPRERREHFG